MKSKMKIKMKVVGSIACLSMILFMGSCAGDGFDEETFSGGVTNTQLIRRKHRMWLLKNWLQLKIM